MTCKKCNQDKEESEFTIGCGQSFYKKRDGTISEYSQTYRRKVCKSCYRKQQYKSQKRKEEKLIAY